MMKKPMQNLITGMALYVTSILLIVFLLPQLPWGPLRSAVTLLSLFPAIFVGLAVTQAVAVMDELQQRIQLQALAFSLVNTLLVSFTIGLLQLSGPPFVNLMWIVPLAALFWGLGIFLAQRRYQ
jgi:hypothetical protein